MNKEFEFKYEFPEALVMRHTKRIRIYHGLFTILSYKIPVSLE